MKNLKTCILAAALLLMTAPAALASDVAGAYEGLWTSGNALMRIEATEDGTFRVNIAQDSSTAEHVEWYYKEAAYDEIADELNTFEIGVKTRTVYGRYIEEPETEEEFSDGAAGFKLNEEGDMVFTDCKEAPGTEVVFHRAEASPEWVAALPEAQDESVNQLFVVAAMGMDLTTATISMHERDADGQWKQILSTPGYVGKKGLCADEDHAEGCAQTPVGTYHFNKAFGIAPDPGCAIPYVQVTDDTYWSGDQREGMHYNEMVDINDFPDLDMENSEHIVYYENEYQYCLNISFNEEGTAGRGSAIFLHCLGARKPYTGGCVAIPENIMRIVMQCVDPGCTVVIDTLENLGGSL